MAVEREVLIRVRAQTDGARMYQAHMRAVEEATRRAQAASRGAFGYFQGLGESLWEAARSGEGLLGVLGRLPGVLGRSARAFAFLDAHLRTLRLSLLGVAGALGAFSYHRVYGVGMHFQGSIDQSIQRLTSEIQREGEAWERARKRAEKLISWGIQYKVKTPYALDEILESLSGFAVLYRGDVEKAKRATQIAALLASKNPEQGLRGAFIALQEAEVGYLLSPMRRFRLPKNLLERYYKQTGSGLEAVAKTLEAIGVREEMIFRVTDTLPGLEAQIQNLYKLLYGDLMKGVYEARRQHLRFVRDRMKDLLNERSAAHKLVQAISSLMGKLATLYYRAIEAPFRYGDKILSFVSNLSKALDPLIANIRAFAKGLYQGFVLPFKMLLGSTGLMGKFLGPIAHILSIFGGRFGQFLMSPAYAGVPVSGLMGAFVGSALAARLGLRAVVRGPGFARQLWRALGGRGEPPPGLLGALGPVPPHLGPAHPAPAGVPYSPWVSKTPVDTFSESVRLFAMAVERFAMMAGAGGSSEGGGAPLPLSPRERLLFRITQLQHRLSVWKHYGEMGLSILAGLGLGRVSQVAGRVHRALAGGSVWQNLAFGGGLLLQRLGVPWGRRLVEWGLHRKDPIPEVQIKRPVPVYAAAPLPVFGVGTPTAGSRSASEGGTGGTGGTGEGGTLQAPTNFWDGFSKVLRERFGGLTQIGRAFRGGVSRGTSEGGTGGGGESTFQAPNLWERFSEVIREKFPRVTQVGQTFREKFPRVTQVGQTFREKFPRVTQVGQTFREKFPRVTQVGQTFREKFPRVTQVGQTFREGLGRGLSLLGRIPMWGWLVGGGLLAGGLLLRGTRRARRGGGEYYSPEGYYYGPEGGYYAPPPGLLPATSPLRRTLLLGSLAMGGSIAAGVYGAHLASSRLLGMGLVPLMARLIPIAAPVLLVGSVVSVIVALFRRLWGRVGGFPGLTAGVQKLGTSAYTGFRRFTGGIGSALGWLIGGGLGGLALGLPLSLLGGRIGEAVIQGGGRWGRIIGFLLGAGIGGRAVGGWASGVGQNLGSQWGGALIQLGLPLLLNSLLSRLPIMGRLSGFGRFLFRGVAMLAGERAASWLTGGESSPWTWLLGLFAPGLLRGGVRLLSWPARMAWRLLGGPRILSSLGEALGPLAGGVLAKGAPLLGGLLGAGRGLLAGVLGKAAGLAGDIAGRGAPLSGAAGKVAALLNSLLKRLGGGGPMGIVAGGNPLAALGMLGAAYSLMRSEKEEGDGTAPWRDIGLQFALLALPWGRILGVVFRGAGISLPAVRSLLQAGAAAVGAGSGGILAALGGGVRTLLSGLRDVASRAVGFVARGAPLALGLAPFVGAASSPGSIPQIQSDAFTKLSLWALGKQESGFNPQAVNKHTGALGLFQVMPQNLWGWGSGLKAFTPGWLDQLGKPKTGWDYEALGRDITPREFLSDPKLQTTIATKKLQEYRSKIIESFQRAGRPVDNLEVLRRLAAIWYSGPKAEYFDPRRPIDSVLSRAPQGAYPSIKAYVDSVTSHFLRAPKEVQEAIASGRDLTAILGLGGAYQAVGNAPLTPPVTAGAGTTSPVVNISVNVNAQTGASPQQIAGAVRDEVRKMTPEITRRIMDAMRGR
ncbi:tape-measure protein with lysozyme [Thermus phage MN1]|nr:tape-measure protein with lysozyme [Thermus phage MN1]